MASVTPVGPAMAGAGRGGRVEAPLKRDRLVGTLAAGVPPATLAGQPAPADPGPAPAGDPRR